MGTFTYQILKDTTERVVVKMTGKFTDTTQEANTIRIAANTFSGALATNGYLVANNQGGAANTPLSYYGLTVHRVWYDAASNGDVELFWNAATPQTIMFLNGNGEYDGNANWITIPNNTRGTTGSKGDIGVATRNMAANDSYTLIVDLRKENEYYQRGHFNDPAAFNYGAHNTLTP